MAVRFSDVSTKIWEEGRSAYAAKIPEIDCPYDMAARWGDWCDWVCGYGEAQHEAFLAGVDVAVFQHPA